MRSEDSRFEKPSTLQLLRASLGSSIATALESAEKSIGSTAPNPPVGCAILDEEGRILALAAHMGAGHPHAEVSALTLCRERGVWQKMRTLVVTLEPCNHHGRTGPCVEAILATPIRLVVFGVLDPNPEVRGGGRERLLTAGIDCMMLTDFRLPEFQSLVARCEDLIAPFKRRVTVGLPWVTLKQVFDRSGGMFPPPGKKTFSSDESIAFAHELRRGSDAILTGSGTVLADSPEFTVRCVLDHPGRRRGLAILDRRRRTPPSYLQAAFERGFDPFISDALEPALRQLASAGALRVLVEAGPTLTAHILATPFWDEHVVIRQAQQNEASDVRSIVRRGMPA